MIIICGFLTALECNKFVFGRGSALDPAREAYSGPQTPRWFKRVLLRGRGRKKRKREGTRGGKGKGGQWWRQGLPRLGDDIPRWGG